MDKIYKSAHSQHTSTNETLDEEKYNQIDVQNEGGRPLWTKHNEAKGAEWGSRNNPGRSHRNPMLEELKDEFAKDERHQRRI